MGKQLVVIDGADQGRHFPLADGGTVIIGSSHRHCDIWLHDLYVARIHCQIDVSDDRIVLTDNNEKSQETHVNGQKVAQQELRLGDVVRVGNSHLRLQAAGDDIVEVEAAEEGYETVQDNAEDAGYEAVEDEPEPAAPAAPTPVPRLPPERLGELVHHRLGHYDLVKVLGKGHCGVVFRARDLKSNEVVALKVLSPQFPSNAEEMQRFVQAIKAMPARHPHLVSLLGAGKTGPYSWMALEYVDGESLADVLRYIAPGRNVPWQRGVRVGIHIGRALDFLHRKRFVHGNITPANILIQSSDCAAKLADLTLARAVEGSALHKAVRGGKLRAELPFLAPERLEGGRVDEATDIYGLGVIIYALLTGRPPFAGATPEETAAQIRQGEPAKPTAHQKGIPESLERIVQKMLARAPADRCRDVGDVVRQLEQVAAETAVAV